MAHNIHFNEATNQHSFFSVQEKPWHGLGKIVKDYPTSKQALEFARLDFEVEKRGLFTVNKHNGNADLIVPEHFATVRTDTQAVLGVVGKQYEVVQNRDAFTFFDAIVQGEGILYETAGALGKGERIFITAKLPNYITVGREDLIEQYLFLTTSHDGTGSITAAFTPIRIVCNNTLNAALRNKSNSVKIRHTNNAKQKLEQAHQLMGITNTLSSQLETIFNNWSKVRITDKEVYKLIQLALIPNKEVLQNIQRGREDELSTYFLNTCNHAYEYALGNETQQLETTRGTLFGAYNGVTGYFQNVRNYKDKEAKMKSLLLGGTGQARTQAAFNLCTAYASKGADAFLLN
ncbi:DUF945 domain-containing protein [Ilyomonas limi]|uniref:DUF945 domain-containing protein n=1 Tax=Ilyomonas limi TaxID=2575867 RepID=A0A4U3KWZ5_9BACT|nr:DUF932 domain-containing protein [Ilyomonas limi]TKK66359.1 DUF945 domain-containing protein [Ilyomonas limi]